MSSYMKIFMNLSIMCVFITRIHIIIAGAASAHPAKNMFPRLETRCGLPGGWSNLTTEWRILIDDCMYVHVGIFIFVSRCRINLWRWILPCDLISSSSVLMLPDENHSICMGKYPNTLTTDTYSLLFCIMEQHLCALTHNKVENIYFLNLAAA